MKIKTALAALISLGSAHLSEATLISYWTFDDAAGNTAVATYGKDASWNNAGTSPTWLATGQVGTALTLDGAANNFFNTDLGGLLNSDKMTVAMWVNPQGAGNYKGLFMVRPSNPGVSGTAAGNGNFGVAWRDIGGGYIDTRGQGATISAEGSVVIDDIAAGNDGWYHVMWVWNGETDTTALFINGVEVSTGTANHGSLIGGNWHIGNDSCCGNGRVFNGLIDDLGVWDEALTETEAQGLFAKTLSPADINPPNDSDGDGLPNEYEEMFPGFLDPNVADADQDVDTTDGDLASPAQADGLSNAQEAALGTDPTDADTDDDGLLDGEEINTFGTNPLVDDSDGDGLLDGEETGEANGFVTDPNKIDTDNDTFTDKFEIDNGSDPTDPNDPPFGIVPSDGLVALYKLDEGAGDSVSDSATSDGDQSSTAMTGTAGWTAEGVVGSALDLDGSSFFSVPDALSTTDTAFTMTAWVKPTSSGSYRGVFATRDLEASPNLNWGLNVEGGIQGDLRFATSATSAGYDTPGVVQGEWNHLAMTWSTDGITSVGKAYLNGAYVGEYTSDANDLMTTYDSAGFYLLGAEPNPNRAFIGQIDEVGVWNVALSDEQVSDIYRNGIVGNGLVPPTDIPLAITDISVADTGNVNLTWGSNPAAGVTYLVKYTTDLSLPFAEWEIASTAEPTDGELTTMEIPATALEGGDKFFFAVKQN